MSWSDVCTNLLDKESLFENQGHKERFREAVKCYENCVFFTKGLCKCLYLASWDMEHFVMILETLNGLVARREKNLKDMKITGEQLADEMKGDERYIMELSVAFVGEEPYCLEDGSEIGEDVKYIINQALKAGVLIDKAEAEI